ncbi:MAG: MFS transporter [SAR202 cluster bacterium]|nr:MFS transporter [SAR202 cluster bacterium]
MATSEPISTPNRKELKSNPLLDLGLNVIIPVIILTKFSGEDRLGPVMGLVVALAFPVGYGIFDFARRRSINFMSALGFASVLLTGGIGLLKLDAQWIAVKEASIPLVAGIAVLVSMKTKSPLVKAVLNKMMDSPAVYAALSARNNVAAFERKMAAATYMIAGSFLLSAGLNFALARLIVKSPSGTVAFNEEIGRMTAFSFPVIAVPSIIVLTATVVYLINTTAKLSGLEPSKILKQK